MAEQGALRIAVVCEAAADQQTACLLADRVCMEHIAWLEPEHLGSSREWLGARPAETFMSWKAVRREADELGIRAHGFFSGESGALDARAARYALLVLERAGFAPGAALLIRDSDNHPERRVGLRQARDAGSWSFEVVIGLAHTKCECWLLAAFEPADKAENSRLTAMKRELGFDPRNRSHQLTAAKENAKRNAKRVLATLCTDDPERDLSQTPLATLRNRGAKNGLAEYLEEIESRLVPLFR